MLTNQPGVPDGWPQRNSGLRSTLRRLTVIASVGVLLIGALTSAQPANAAPTPFSLMGAAVAAEREFGVPTEVTLAVSFADTLWVDHGTAPSFANGYGFMHLQDNRHNDGLQHAAALLGRAPSDLMTDARTNVRGGAVLLREAYIATHTADSALAHAHDLTRWYQPVAAYLRSSDKSATRNYTDHVFAVLMRGVKSGPGAQTASISPHPDLIPDRGVWQSVPSDYERAALRRITGADMPDVGGLGGKLAARMPGPVADFNGDEWAPSPNFGYDYIGQHGRPTALIEVVIHDCQGQYSGCLSTLQNNTVELSKRVSAHFLVRSSDGWRAKLVSVDDVAWHATTHNNFSMGIEHEGFAASGYQWYTATMYRQSSWLTAWACTLYYFGCDRNHIVAHSEIDSLKGDPGIYWDWNYYMTCVYWRTQYIWYQYPPEACY